MLGNWAEKTHGIKSVAYSSIAKVLYFLNNYLFG